MSSEKITMKCHVFVTFLFAFLMTNSIWAIGPEPLSSFNEPFVPGVLASQKALTPEEFDARKNRVLDLLKEAEKQSRNKAEYLFEDKTARADGCAHCPRFFDLTDSVNKVLEELKKKPEIIADEEIPLSINRLRFLYYLVQSREDNGQIKCKRYLDTTVDLRPTKFEGEMQLIVEDVFKFDGISQVQILTPGTDEVTYYYRGEGAQKNVIVQAILNKDGGKFRYYYLHEANTNPYNLPALSDADLSPKEKRAKQKEQEKKDRQYNEQMITEAQVASGVSSKDKLDWAIEPKLEMRGRLIPKDYHLARGEVSQGILGSGLRVNANSSLSIRGNKANMSLQNEEGKSYVEIALDTSLSGKTEHRIIVPYEVRLGAKEDQDALEIKGRLEEMTNVQTLSLSLTDRYTQYFRTEIRKDKNTNIMTTAVARDFALGPKEAISVAVGKNEVKAKYAALQHRKMIKDNITMVLDVRVDENRQASVYYQLQSRF